MSTDGAAKTITYTGSGAILAEGNVQINANLVTNGNNSFPTNILGIMTPNTIGFNEANIDVMGLFYAEGTVNAQKQTDIVGTIVSNYFDMGTNVPSVLSGPRRHQSPSGGPDRPGRQLAHEDGFLGEKYEPSGKEIRKNFPMAHPEERSDEGSHDPSSLRSSG